jgi:superkiller protein 3
VLLGGCGGQPPAPPDPGSPFAGESLPTILAHADSAFREGEYVEAQAAYEEAIRIDPENSGATANLGTCLLHNRQIRRAREVLEAFVSRHPEDVPTRLVLARVFIRQADLERAAALLEAILKTQPDLLTARYNLGFLSYRLRRYDVARTHLRRAVEIRPEFPEAFYTLGLNAMALGHLDEAIAAFERAVVLDPRHVGARFNLANAHARAGNTAEWQKHQAVFADLSGRSKAQQERETQIKASSVEAIRLIQQQRLPEALAEYAALAERFPDHAPLHLEVGRLQHRLGRREEALRSLRRAVELDARLSQPHYLLAEIYREIGDTEAARREIEIFAALETIPEGKSGY